MRTITSVPSATVCVPGTEDADRLALITVRGVAYSEAIHSSVVVT
jgi:hypothetical protein